MPSFDLQWGALWCVTWTAHRRHWVKNSSVWLVPMGRHRTVGIMNWDLAKHIPTRILCNGTPCNLGSESISLLMKTPSDLIHKVIISFCSSVSWVLFLISLFPHSFLHLKIKFRNDNMTLEKMDAKQLPCVWVGPQAGIHFTEISDAHWVCLSLVFKQNFEVQKAYGKCCSNNVLPK